MLFEVASSTLCSQRVVQEPDMNPRFFCGPALKGKASGTNSQLDIRLIFGFMSESLNVSHSSIIKSTASL